MDYCVGPQEVVGSKNCLTPKIQRLLVKRALSIPEIRGSNAVINLPSKSLKINKKSQLERANSYFRKINFSKNV